MPYIRKLLREEMRPKFMATAPTKGSLTYQITEVCLRYLEGHGRSFDAEADIIAALECAKLEFYRRVLAPHEDGKIQENGDVYPVSAAAR